MEKLANDTFSLWREQGRQSIQQNFEEFRSLLAQARNFVQNGKYDMAAVYAKMAAFHGCWKHCGLFISPELEHILLTIGQKAIPSSLYPNKSTSSPETPRNVLHVSTSVGSIGGHSRMLLHWIQQDPDRSHSLVLTEQGANSEIPKTLEDAVLASHGKIYMLNETIGSLICWAKRLREIAATADLVVLHIFNHDVIPIIAFANKKQSPPIIFLDHADHLFWLGASISDVVVNLRESGMRLSQERRGVEAECNLLLPIILSPTQRTLSRAEAKRQLGLGEDSILLLSVARSCKYKTIDGISFADAHVSLLKQHKRAILLVVGPGNRKDWSAAIQQTQGRIIVHGEREDTSVFYQAADIYVDSFPFVSNTSLLEAGSYGVPLVTRYPYSDACEMLGADTPGLTGNLIRACDLEQYTVVLSRLVEDEKFRLSLGETTRKKIAETHTGNKLQRSLEDIYVRAASMARVSRTLASMDQMFLGEPDVLLPYIYGIDFTFSEMIGTHIRLMPLPQRLHMWSKLVKTDGFDQVSLFNFLGFFTLLLPEWLNLRLRKGAIYGWLKRFKPDNRILFMKAQGN
jgi:glycosyltransferase involved in cell wall biosynthesis